MSVSALLRRLRPGTTYYYRLIATGSGVTITSPIRTFRTHAAIVISGVPTVGLTTSSGLAIRITTTSHARIRHIIVLIDHHRVVSSGLHTLTITTSGAAGTTTRTLRFRVSTSATSGPRFTG